MKKIFPLATLTFRGPRFENHTLDLAVLPELVAYGDAVLMTAKEIWKQKNPDRARLPKGFEERIVLKIGAIATGSVTVPVLQEIDFRDGEIPFGPMEDNEVLQAAHVIVMAFDAAAQELPPPKQLPAVVIPFVAAIGKTLGADEQLLTCVTGRTKPVALDKSARERIARWEERTYKDTVDLVGEVRATDLDGGKFALRLADDSRIDGHFSPEHEARVMEAFRDHQTCRLRIVGEGEFLFRERILRRVLSTSRVEVLFPETEQTGGENERPIWEQITELGTQVPVSEWEKVPEDLGYNLDHYLYGASKRTT